MTIDKENPRSGILRRATFLIAVFLLVLAVLIFLPAGIKWWRGWFFFLVFFAFTVLSAAYLWRANPEIFVARSRIHRGTKAWDKLLMAFLLVSLAAIFAVPGFDARYGWSRVPIWPTVLGYVLISFAFAGSTWVYAVNRFAEPSVRIQSERGHKVIDTGPYAIVRHPLYVAGLFLFAGIPPALGSYWAWIPAAFGTLVIVVRTLLEDRMLQNELEGYKDYASRVRYRLIPGAW